MPLTDITDNIAQKDPLAHTLPISGTVSKTKSIIYNKIRLWEKLLALT
jgi:hypothetical protein